MLKWLGLVLLGACASHAAGDELARAVKHYNDSLRWKRFTYAAAYLPASERAAFLERYLASEADLHIDTLEIRAVSPAADAEVPAYDITVVAEAYRLPSTVLERVVMVQRWEQRDGAWLLTRTEGDLAPRRLTNSAAPTR